MGLFLGGAGLGGGCFFCLGGKAGTGDFGPKVGRVGDFGAKGSLPNKLSGFCKESKQELVRCKPIICLHHWLLFGYT